MCIAVYANAFYLSRLGRSKLGLQSEITSRYAGG